MNKSLFSTCHQSREFPNTSQFALSLMTSILACLKKQMGHAGEITYYFNAVLLKLECALDHLENMAKSPFKHRIHVKADDNFNCHPSNRKSKATPCCSALHLIVLHGWCCCFNMKARKL